MRVLLCAAMAAMLMSTGAAFAKGGGGDGGDRYFDPNTAPQGFYQMNPAYQAAQEREAYVINQERTWQTAQAENHNTPVAPTASAAG